MDRRWSKTIDDRHSVTAVLIPLLTGLLLAGATLLPGGPKSTSNRPLLAQTAPRAAVISEIAWAGMRDQAGVDRSGDEWIVLANPGAGDLDLDGWRLEAVDGTPSITLTGTLPAGGAYLLERTDDGSAPPLADQLYTGGLENAGEDLSLTDADGQVVDEAGRETGWLGGEAAARRTMLRRNADLPGHQPAAWGTGAVDGTPRNSVADRDRDGFRYSPNIDWDAPSGGGGPMPGLEDCDDRDPEIHPGAPERLNLLDDDCDVEVDEDFSLGPLHYEVHFSDPDRLWAPGPSDEVTGIEQALLDFLSGAERSIDAALYELTRPRLRDALVAAHARGIRVRVVSDDEGEKNPGALFGDLRAAGIVVVPDPYSSYLQHNKFVVADGRRVWTGSANWTGTGMSYNQENVLVLDAPHIALAYTREFEEMFTERRFSTHKRDDTPHVFRYDDAEVEVRFSPSDDIETVVAAALDNARDELAFAMFYWTSDILTEIVLNKAAGPPDRPRIGFHGVWDAVGEKNRASDDKRLCDAGLPLKVEVFGGKVHDKMAVLDANGAAPVVITGSYNWTAAADEKNDENLLIIRGHRRLAAAYRAEIDRLWEALPDQAVCASPGAESGLPACGDGLDNDYDEAIDGADPSCRESTAAACLDGVDNDGDGLIDHADLDCFRAPMQTPTPAPGSTATATTIATPAAGATSTPSATSPHGVSGTFTAFLPIASGHP